MSDSSNQGAVSEKWTVGIRPKGMLISCGRRRARSAAHRDGSNWPQADGPMPAAEGTKRTCCNRTARI